MNGGTKRYHKTTIVAMSFRACNALRTVVRRGLVHSATTRYARGRAGTSLQRGAVSIRALSDMTTTSGGSSLSKTSSDGVVGDPIDFDVAAKIEGNESQVSGVRLAEYCHDKSTVAHIPTLVLYRSSQ